MAKAISIHTESPQVAAVIVAWDMVLKGSPSSASEEHKELRRDDFSKNYKAIMEAVKAERPDPNPTRSSSSFTG